MQPLKERKAASMVWEERTKSEYKGGKERKRTKRKYLGEREKKIMGVGGGECLEVYLVSLNVVVSPPAKPAKAARRKSLSLWLLVHLVTKQDAGQPSH